MIKTSPSPTNVSRGRVKQEPSRPPTPYACARCGHKELRYIPPKGFPKELYLRPPTSSDARLLRDAKTWQYLVLERNPDAYCVTGFADSATLHTYLTHHLEATDGYLFLGILPIYKAWLPSTGRCRQDLADLLHEESP